MKKPNPNLWNIAHTSNLYPNGCVETVLVLAPDAARASAKARAFLMKRGEKRVQIVNVKHEGTVDVF